MTTRPKTDSGHGHVIGYTHGGTRTWRAKPIPAGFRLYFQDSGDQTWTNAGVAPNIDEAVREMHRLHGRRRR